MIIKTQTINKKLQKGAGSFIAESEKAVMYRVAKCAAGILPSLAEKPVILLSGPSGSSKTTTAIKLAKELRKSGNKVCYISMDKYFKDFTEEELELKKLGRIDLESPERVDAEYLKKDIDILLAGGEISLPSYDFLTSRRTLGETRLKRDGGFIIVEGIHALNSDLLGGIEQNANKIYVSVRTRVVDSADDRLHPCKIRLMRRMLRDKLYRGRSVEETIKAFSKVQYGENKYIMPYKSTADYDIDTFIEYEPCIYRRYLYDSLLEYEKEYADIRDIVTALDEIDPLDYDEIPSDAMIREFIGGSSLSY